MSEHRAGSKAELRAMAVIVRNFARLSPAGRAWVLDRLAEDDRRARVVRAEVSA